VGRQKRRPRPGGNRLRPERGSAGQAGLLRPFGLAKREMEGEERMDRIEEVREKNLPSVNL
jgi:hypothetical protein